MDGDVAELGEKETAFFRTDTVVSDHEATEPRKRAPYEQGEYLETWLSGRKHLTANEVRGEHLEPRKTLPDIF
jgi:hypothetical protein